MAAALPVHYRVLFVCLLCLSFPSQSLACTGDSISCPLSTWAHLTSVPVTLPVFWGGGGSGACLAEQPHICFRKDMVPWFGPSFNKLILVPAGWFIP